ncbi:hypothetical protein H640_08359 [Cutibacterium granulosum TM11]|uniref:Uncharacterized protein n=1 Tax=Cutibacterium granulosum TM11 TaxID=1292373 RepID=A0ACB4ULX3_9ACTN|nr:hypothetical protein H640_08359 [Cutibacterium granulosum TM11]
MPWLALWTFSSARATWNLSSSISFSWPACLFLSLLICSSISVIFFSLSAAAVEPSTIFSFSARSARA